MKDFKNGPMLGVPKTVLLSSAGTFLAIWRRNMGSGLSFVAGIDLPTKGFYAIEIGHTRVNAYLKHGRVDVMQKRW